MNTLIHKIALPLVASFTFVAFVALPATASEPKALLIAPEPGFGLPQFGFSSFNIHGVGDRVAFVRWGSRAARLGLEPGDVILRLNGFPLTYHGAWNDALYRAMARGGLVRLTIRDVRTGLIVSRQTYIGGGHGPITPKIYAGGYGPQESYGSGHPHHVGPNTPKSKVGGNHAHGTNDTLKKIAQLFD